MREPRFVARVAVAVSAAAVECHHKLNRRRTWNPETPVVPLVVVAVCQGRSYNAPDRRQRFESQMDAAV